MALRVFKYQIIILLLLCGGAPNAFAQNQSVTNFRDAKRLIEKIHADQPITFYCGCTYDRNKPSFDQCGYKPIKNNKRASRIEWEHVVPASQFGRSFTEWTKGDALCVKPSEKSFKGRKCAQKASPKYNLMAADLYNLQPTIGEVNALRRNYPFREIAGEARAFGMCDIEIHNKTVEPATRIRGDIARTYLYMAGAYKGRNILEPATRDQMLKWSEADPVDSWECERHERIRAIQKAGNAVLDDLCPARLDTQKPFREQVDAVAQ